MLRIAICNPDRERAQTLFDTAVQAIRQIAAKCELSCHTNSGKILENLAGDKNYYDIYILDAEDIACLELAKQIRSSNLIASLIFTAREPSLVHSLLKLRPSAWITEYTDGSQLAEALKYCCGEQLRCLSCFTVKNKDSIIRTSFDDIHFFESRQRLVIMHGRKQTIEFYAKLSDVLSKLPQDQFIRCHQSFIVNLCKIGRLDKANRCFILQSGAAVEISKASYSQVVARYMAYIEAK